jgi:hypothetical protein
MKPTLWLVAVLLVGCSESGPAKKGAGGGSAGGESSVADTSSLEEVREQACACKDQDCVDRVNAELTIERRRFEKTLGEAEECLDKVGTGSGADAILGKMRSFKDKVCACRDKSCVEEVEKEMMEWAMKNMDKMKNTKPTKAQDEAADKIEDEMDKCKERLSGGEPAPF